MIFKKILLLLVLTSCTPQLNNIKNNKTVKNSFHATGFAYIFDEKDFAKISMLNCENISILKVDLKIIDENNLLNFLKTKIHD